MKPNTIKQLSKLRKSYRYKDLMFNKTLKDLREFMAEQSRELTRKDEWEKVFRKTMKKIKGK